VEGRGATAEEAAAWVEYCNGDVHSKYGSMRAANGSPEPFHVHYWEIGNEIWGDWVRGHSDAETYAKNLNRYVEKMRAVDPSIAIIATGDNNLKWNETVLKIAGKNVDYLSVHHYYGPAEMKGDANNLRARPLHYEQFYLRMKKMFQELVPGHKIRLAVNEWNTTLPLPAQHSIQSAIYAARLMNVFERGGDVVQMSAVSDMVNGWSGGIIQASRHAVYVTPTYLVNQLYASHLGTKRLASTLRGPTFDSTLEGVGVPTIDAVATRSPDGRQMFIKVVNIDPSQTVSMEILVNGVRIGPEARLETLNSAGLNFANDFAHPDLVRITESTINTSRFIATLPEHSVSIISIGVE
jgi:alpha-N-arabinofuranosidase